MGDLTREQEKAIYVAARHVGIPGEKLTALIGTLGMCGLELRPISAPLSATERKGDPDLLAWLADRLQNCETIASHRIGADRSGWLEDAAYFKRAIAMLAAATAPAEPVQEAVASDQIINPLPPAVMEAINQYGRYYAEQHKLGMSVRDDMKYIASVAIRNAPPSTTWRAAQEFAWLIEKHEQPNQTFYWAGVVNEGGFWKWTANAHEAVRFPTKDAAETACLRLKLYRAWPDDNLGDHVDAQAVEHGFIYAPPVEAEATRELENIVNAKRFDHKLFRDDTEWADWAQSRARHTLSRMKREKDGG